MNSRSNHLLASALVCLLAFCSVADAAEKWHTSTIKTIYPQASGVFVLEFDVEATTCLNSNKYHYVVPNQNGMTDEGAKKIYAAAMLALATDKAVSVAFDDSTPSCYVNRMSVTR